MKNRGFTLIELLVTMTILAILTMVTMAQFQTAKKKANDVARKGDLNAVSKALEMYFNDYGVFPIESAIVFGGTFEDSSASPAYVYMKRMPKENVSSNKPYCYKVSADRKKFALFAQLENYVDKECDHNGNNIADDSTYLCGSPSKTYCYGITSPNSSLNSTGDLQ